MESMGCQPLNALNQMSSILACERQLQQTFDQGKKVPQVVVKKQKQYLRELFFVLTGNVLTEEELNYILEV